MLESFEPNVFANDTLLPIALQQETTISFSLKANKSFEDLKLCVIPVLIQGSKGRQAFDLLIDTGSEVTVLNKNVAAIVGIPFDTSLVVGRGIGSKTELQRGIVANIEIVTRIELEGQGINTKISFGSSSVIVGDVSGKFSKYSILGVLGAQTIQDVCLKIDYSKKYLEFSKVLALKNDERSQ